MSHALYNEIEPFAADWLDELVRAGHIAPGRVDRRSIADLTAADVAGPGQRHFFAGIGGWSYALRLAGVPDDADIWTGSCPCQPFSQAGRRSGASDPRHLWPAWFALIRECRPAIVFGEQVAGPDGLAWLDGVFADLEGSGYACGAAVVSAGGVSAPHGRHRLYFVAHANGVSCGQGVAIGGWRDARVEAQPDECGPCDGRSAIRVVDAKGKRCTARRHGIKGERKALEPRRYEPARGMGNSDGEPSRRHAGAVPSPEGPHSSLRSRVDGPRAPGGDMDPWRSAVWIDCYDGKLRPIPTEPALFPLAHGVPNRMGLLRGGGNAIVPQVAATFIEAALDAIGGV